MKKAVLALLLMTGVATPALADPPHRSGHHRVERDDRGRDHNRQWRGERRDNDRRHWDRRSENRREWNRRDKDRRDWQRRAENRGERDREWRQQAENRPDVQRPPERLEGWEIGKGACGERECKDG